MDQAIHKDEQPKGRKVCENLTPEERERLERFGAIDFKSAGATRKTK